MVEGYVSASEIEPARADPPACTSDGGLVSGVWHEGWGLAGLDDAAATRTDPAGRGWLAWSGRAWWREEASDAADPVTAEQLLDGLLTRGPAALQRIDGSFAVVWYDAAAGSFSLARDPFGIEPLHYAVLGDRLAFASRLWSLSRWLPRGLRLDLAGLRDYLAYGFCPGEHTLVEGVAKVPAGTAVVVRPKGPGRVATETRRWHRLSYRSQSLTDEEAIADAFRTTLAAAVRRRMGGGRPGVMLSGGMDSSTVAALMRRFEPGEIRTFTFRCRGRSYDESSFARGLSRQLGTKHTQLELTEQDAVDFGDAVAAMDSPFSDAGIEIGTWRIAEAAAGEVDYVLAGDGGDEFWASHPVYAAQRLMRLYDATPVGRAPRQWLRRVLGALPDSPRKRDALVVAKRLLPDPDLPVSLQHLRWKVHHDGHSLRRLLNGVPVPNGPPEEFYRSALRAFDGFDGGSGSPDAMLYNDYTTATSFYVSRLLFFRSFGVEHRLPFLDARLTELGTDIPFEKKLEGLHRTKRLFRRAMKGIVPDEIRNRSDKLGHSVPMKNWLRSGGSLSRAVAGVLLEELADQRGLVQRSTVETMLAEHAASRHNHSHRLWALYVLELWLKRHLDTKREHPVDLLRSA